MIDGAKRLVKSALVRFIHARNRREARALESLGIALSPATWGATVSGEGHLVVGGCDLAEVARSFGTPLHVVDEQRLAAGYRDFLGSFTARWPRVELGLSYKTNPLPGAIRILHAAGANAEVISHFELWLALALGVPPGRIVFNGPGKDPAGLRLAVERGVRIINIDSADEAGLIQQYAEAAGCRQAVGVRVVTSVGWSAQFGLPLHDGSALAAFRRITTLDRLVPVGLHVHLGTGIKDVGIYARAVEEVFAFALQLRRELGIDISFLDLGGGFGVPTVASLSTMDQRLLAAGHPSRPVDVRRTPAIGVYAQVIAGLAEKHFGAPGPHSPTLFFEPGRALTSSAQLLLLSVLAIKPGPGGRRNVILDGGRNVAFPTDYEHHALYPVQGLNDPRTVHYDFFGPLCHPGDVLFQSRYLPELKPGDVVAVMDSGAYFVPNQMNFSNPRTAAVIVHQGTARLTRRRESFEHMVALDDLEPAVSCEPRARRPAV